MSRNTVAKKQILAFIHDAEHAVSHADIHKSLGDICDRVTVYRVLERLVNEDSIHKIVNTDGVINYAACKKCVTKHNHNHVHFSCEICKALTCLNSVEFTLNLPTEYEFREAYFTVSGICPACKTI
jgi:Fur family ferric uptake transcriptional regulator